LVLTFWLMKCYTRHGDATKVGSYVGKNAKQVIRDAENEGFEVIVTDSVYREGFAADVVLEQTPLPNAKVKEGRTIYLKITKAAGDLVKLPDLAGRDEINLYISNLKIIGVKIGKVDTIVDPNLVDGTIHQVLVRGNDVTNQLATGIRVPQGSEVDFVITKRQSDEVLVPDVTNLTADQYSFMLESLGLKLGAVLADPSVTNQNTAKVYRTEPAVGTAVKIGATVSIYVREE
jgi:UDP-N-acetylmuramate--alanine ligase